MKKFSMPIRFGGVISGGLIASFLVHSLFHAHINPLYSLLNIVITGFGIFETIRYHKFELGDKFSYAKGFAAGIVAGAIATIVFTLFFLFYVTEINTDFLPELLDYFKGDYQVGPGLITFVVALMGFVTSVVLTFTFMQYFKPSSDTSLK
jgi:glycerol uptake facilitator-like aquaporin